MKTCACSSKARCAQCAEISVREERGDWRWRGDRAPRRRALGIFSGTIGLDGLSVRPFPGPGPVALGAPMTPGSEISSHWSRSGSDRRRASEGDQRDRRDEALRPRR